MYNNKTHFRSVFYQYLTSIAELYNKINKFNNWDKCERENILGKRHFLWG